MSQTISGTIDLSGPAFQAVTPGTSESPGVVTRDGNLTIVLLAENTDVDTSFVQLPSGADLGDIVIIYPTPDGSGNWTINILPASGDSFWFHGESGGVGAPTSFLKIASSAWAHLSVPSEEGQEAER